MSNDEHTTSKLSALTPSERSEIRSLAARVIAAAGADEEIEMGLTVVPVHGAGQHYNRRDVELLVFKMAREIEALAEERSELLVLRHLVKRIDETLRVPAAEYVPAIRDVFDLIDALGKESP